VGRASTIRNPSGKVASRPVICAGRSFGTARLKDATVPARTDCGTGTTCPAADPHQASDAARRPAASAAFDRLGDPVVTLIGTTVSPWARIEV
jgi:hypothetical protein